MMKLFTTTAASILLLFTIANNNVVVNATSLKLGAVDDTTTFDIADEADSTIRIGLDRGTFNFPNDNASNVTGNLFIVSEYKDYDCSNALDTNIIKFSETSTSIVTCADGTPCDNTGTCCWEGDLTNFEAWTPVLKQYDTIEFCVKLTLKLNDVELTSTVTMGTKSYKFRITGSGTGSVTYTTDSDTTGEIGLAAKPGSDQEQSETPDLDLGGTFLVEEDLTVGGSEGASLPDAESPSEYGAPLVIVVEAPNSGYDFTGVTDFKALHGTDFAQTYTFQENLVAVVKTESTGAGVNDKYTITFYLPELLYSNDATSNIKIQFTISYTYDSDNIGRSLRGGEQEMVQQQRKLEPVSGSLDMGFPVALESLEAAKAREAAATSSSTTIASTTTTILVCAVTILNALFLL